MGKGGMCVDGMRMAIVSLFPVSVWLTFGCFGKIAVRGAGQYCVSVSSSVWGRFAVYRDKWLMLGSTIIKPIFKSRFLRWQMRAAFSGVGKAIIPNMVSEWANPTSLFIRAILRSSGVDMRFMVCLLYTKWAHREWHASAPQH